MKKIKKEYIAPSVDIHAFNFESMLMASPAVVNETKGDELTFGVTGAGGDGGDGEAAKMSNSGMSWDDEEEW